jgi:fumarylacetoacetate (FAA) hydrolase
VRFVTYEHGGRESYGALIDDNELVDLPAGFAWHAADLGRASGPEVIAGAYGTTLVDLIRKETFAMPVARDIEKRAKAKDLPATFNHRPLRLALKDVTLKAPIPRPPSMRDGYAFRQHVATARKNRGLEMIPEFDEFPVFYFTNHQAVTGPGDVVVEKLHTEQLDFELEAAIVVGAGGKNLRAPSGDKSIFGLTIMNDWSARKLQMQEMKLSLGPAKGKDFATSLGPWLVTLDELADKTKSTPHGAQFDLAMTADVNGKRVSNGNLKDMTFTFAQIMERASYGVMLHPGDVIGSGTVGTGCFLELNGSGITNQWLAPGDEVVLAIDKLGVLKNRIVLAGAAK